MPMSMVTCRRGRLSPGKSRSIPEAKPMAGLGSRNISVSEASRPVLPRHARLKFDETRQGRDILAPERVPAPDQLAVAGLQPCDRVRRGKARTGQPAPKYTARR